MRPARMLRSAASFGLRCLLVLVVLEGASSLLLIALATPERLRPPLAEEFHTRYDPQLGWANVPGVRREDLYGPGRTLTVNAQGFRGLRDTSARVPPGKLRAICSGDSFTLGYGVDDEATWCHRLQELEPRLETVNMGQGGYGIDQAFLWYARDGVRLEHQLHLFAFIREDFGRMQTGGFFGYAKPYLRLENGRLVTHNVPVPRAGHFAPWLWRNLDLLEESRSVQVLRPLLRALRGEPAGGEEKLEPQAIARLATAVFVRLRELNERRGSRLVMVYLPTREDHRNPNDEWRRRIRQLAAANGLVFVDLVEEIRRLPLREALSLYIPDGKLDYLGADGHFNARGNAWVAERLHARLMELPALRRRFESLAGPASTGS